MIYRRLYFKGMLFGTVIVFLQLGENIVKEG